MAKKVKRGVKPGTKRGPYKKARAKRPNKIIDGLKEAVEWSAMNKSFMEATQTANSVGSLISELQSSISQLEGQLAAQIDRIKSILI